MFPIMLTAFGTTLLIGTIHTGYMVFQTRNRQDFNRLWYFLLGAIAIYVPFSLSYRLSATLSFQIAWAIHWLIAQFILAMQIIFYGSGYLHLDREDFRKTIALVLATFTCLYIFFWVWPLPFVIGLFTTILILSILFAATSIFT